ncbi:MAG: nucleotide exchange factor GrpE [Acidobacteria bacterium]|nr:MAG: nucleotide exchange factor GrpE [Acidobacteriota bacterium]
MAKQTTSPTRVADDEAYELDLEDGGSLDEAVEDAVAAVERHQRSAASKSPDAEGDAEAESEAEPDAASRIAELERQLEEAQQRYLRTLADFDNFRKRAERDKENLRRYAMFEPLKSILEVADNLERALSAEGTVEDVKRGLEMTMKSLEDVLKKLGVEKITAVGQPFDPTVHEAVSRVESAEVTVPTVVSEMQKGYRYHDRLLRPAMATVAMPAAGDAAGDEGSPSAPEAAG